MGVHREATEKNKREKLKIKKKIKKLKTKSYDTYINGGTGD